MYTLIKYKKKNVRFDFADQTICLTDMWRASGADPFKKVAHWQRLTSTKQLINKVKTELQTGVLDLQPGSSVELKGLIQKRKTQDGYNAETWGHQLLAIAYAEYLDVSFHLWCLHVVLKHLQGNPAPEKATLRTGKRRSSKYATGVKMMRLFKEHIENCIRQGVYEPKAGMDIITLVMYTHGFLTNLDDFQHRATIAVPPIPPIGHEVPENPPQEQEVQATVEKEPEPVNSTDPTPEETNDIPKVEIPVTQGDGYYYLSTWADEVAQLNFQDKQVQRELFTAFQQMAPEECCLTTRLLAKILRFYKLHPGTTVDYALEPARVAILLNTVAKAAPLENFVQRQEGSTHTVKNTYLFNRFAMQGIIQNLTAEDLRSLTIKAR